MDKTERLEKRNKAIRLRFQNLGKKNPKWHHDAILDTLSDEFYLSVRTISAILSEEGNYKPKIIN